ncbi:peptidoglycan D,D-transpeptidase FtsI family protein [Cryobacterium luteum]|uniref:Penicillin-binding protein 2 n=1 Tax=Cryobacterium luteum TaxID=1424661 RepID=A0A1H8GT13_9MICO|nr:penicillin-binding protein 2 [Cryobacterium luteum]TFB84614.1 penicillin-binding protein 2 [Cryobacterium luteum]SEN46637.1 cell division protein FtsI (penicillin-binding protein 3) [Cryobacterium luteum]
MSVRNSSARTTGTRSNPTNSRSSRRRTFFTVAVLFAVIGVFLVRLVDIQVVQADSLTADSVGNRSVGQVVYGSRGEIVDANGVVLAGTVMRYNITMSPVNATPFKRIVDGEKVEISVAEAAAEIGAATGQTGDAILLTLSTALEANAKANFAYIAQKVDVDVLRAVQDLHIPWTYSENSPSRVYPNGAVAGNVLGFLSGEGVPQAGLESGQDACLASTNGSETYEKGADGVRIPGSSVTSTAAVDGGDVVTTIDSDLQWFVQQTLAARAQETGAAWATAVVQDAKTGKLLAVADYPSVDPNNVGGTENPDDRGSRAFTQSFEPGSTFKALTAASVLDAGVATLGTGVVAPYRYLPSNGANINDSHSHPDQQMTMTGVLIDSSNTGMSKFGELLTDQQRYDYMKAFGVGSATETGFPREDGGILHPAGEWDNQTSYATMFGQGLTTTALQVSSMYQTIANDGVRMPVQLVEGCRQSDGTVTNVPDATGTRVLSESAANDTSDILEMVYQKSWVQSKWNIPGYRVAAKTGTAQMPDGKGGYSNGYLVSVSGFAPADDPQYVVSVSIADPVKLNTSAAPAPVFQEIMSQVLKKYRAVPSGATAPDLPSTW